MFTSQSSGWEFNFHWHILSLIFISHFVYWFALEYVLTWKCFEKYWSPESSRILCFYTSCTESDYCHFKIGCLCFFFFSTFQKQCIEFAIEARPSCRYMPKNKNSLKYKIWKVVVSPKFEYVVMILIALNTVVLMMKVNHSFTFSLLLNSLSIFFLLSLLRISNDTMSA